MAFHPPPRELPSRSQLIQRWLIDAASGVGAVAAVTLAYLAFGVAAAAVVARLW